MKEHTLTNSITLTTAPSNAIVRRSTYSNINYHTQPNENKYNCYHNHNNSNLLNAGPTAVISTTTTSPLLTDDTDKNDVNIDENILTTVVVPKLNSQLETKEENCTGHNPTIPLFFHTNNLLLFQQQQQQFAFFPNASEKVMANTRKIIVLSMYASSIFFSVFLFFLAGVYCQVTSCSIAWAEKNRQYAQFFPICASCFIAFLSTCWLISNFRRMETSCMREYSFLELPTAVFSALLAGVCAVIEIHYNFDYLYLYWSEKWALAAADAVCLSFLHAGLAFALT